MDLINNNLQNTLVDENTLTITNEKVANFYRSHPEYDFEEVSLLAIDLIENWKLKSTKNDVREIIKESAVDQTRDLQRNLELTMENNSNALSNKIGMNISREIERIDNNRCRSEINIITALNNLQENQKEVQEFLNNYKSSSIKGGFGENFLENILNEMYPSAEITNTTGIPQSCDFRLDRGNGCEIILIETKEYSRNVDLREVEKFKRDIDVQKNHGIFLSQKSGITSKHNYQFEFKGTNVLVYLHNVNYNADLIRIAISLIDSIAPKLKEIDENIIENSISDELLSDFNTDMMNFIDNKLNLIKNMKEFNKKMVEDIEKINIPSLNQFLYTKFGAPTREKGSNICGNFVCDVCNKFTTTSKRGLASHKAKCRKKSEII